ncbi:hypothetical protein CXB51_000089 [Gossypium anomalum]|uniref:GAG-pre-integrase domain-containing protein n=1 Tax=Gossypium anomalum TaxID=47600 RepID=A0A8J6DCP4_9ROSI|nr:hypothetical protein CXB51_000089 [Gossypium anomalum]
MEEVGTNMYVENSNQQAAYKAASLCSSFGERIEEKFNFVEYSYSKGYKYIVKSGVLKISKGSLDVMKGQRKTAKLYILQGSTVTGDAIVASSSLYDDNITKFWHIRLRHMSENGLVELSKRGLLDEGHPECLREQDGVAERMNRTIMEKVICMLSNANLPKSYRVEVACTACFLIKRSPSVTIEKKTPQEVWSGNPADYSDLKIFGCPVYAHVDNGKLEPRSIKCVFLSYKTEVKGYKLWCLENKKVMINRDVVFDETAMLTNLSIKDYSNKENQNQVEHHINPESTIESTPQANKKIQNRVASSPQYSIAKYRTSREIKPPKKYTEADLVAYALNVAEDIEANQ